MQGKPGREAECDGERLLSLFDKQDAEFIVAHFFSDEELLTPRTGASRLVAEELRYLSKTGRRVRDINLDLRPGPTSGLRRFFGRLLEMAMRTQNSKPKPGKVRHLSARFLGLFTWMLINELSARADAVFPARGRGFIGGDGPALILFNQPFHVHAVSCRLRRAPEAKLAVIEHNIEWKLYRERVGGGILSDVIGGLIRWVELDNLRQADYVLCISPKDREVLIRAGLRADSVFTWLPLGADTKAVPAPLKRRHGKRGDFVIGFVGTNYEPNIMAVKEIIRIARELGKGYEFRVFGPVAEPFRGESGLPDNVIFTGWVDDLARELSSCDAFINPKISSDTGTEVKMFDYLRHAKRIISTPEGARGFESVLRVSIMGTDAMPRAIRKIAAGQE